MNPGKAPPGSDKVSRVTFIRFAGRLDPVFCVGKLHPHSDGSRGLGMDHRFHVDGEDARLGIPRDHGLVDQVAVANRKGNRRPGRRPSRWRTFSPAAAPIGNCRSSASSASDSRGSRAAWRGFPRSVRPP